ncbi:Rab11 family-interacting protein 5 [Acipenser ruthenus]|uniref:Rab11 family-interacting protein 5 n=1 Tax=Acipenser ruthenus TaxID=7906 RepID=A0A444UE22_ACIRT|nr:Rab11 family-interacting protein 5 [Acipenser ruthenus]
MSLFNVDDDHRWMPTHVQVTVLRASGLRAKGKHGTSDVYTIIQVGKDKFSTSVLEKTTSPEWKEECSFELLPGVLEADDRSAYPPGSSDLILTVMHRALIGMDNFLGQAVIPLYNIFQEKRSRKNEWYTLHSKSGKKEKERGAIQVTVQFTRNNLTASMFDLSMKDKPRSTFGKFKDKMKGKKRGEGESASAIVPSGIGALSERGGRSASEGGGEQEDEEHEEGKRSGVRGFFKKPKLRKSSDSHSNTSLASGSSVSSSPGGSLSPTAGISVVVSDLSNSPSVSSNLTDSPVHTSQPSPKLLTHKRAFSDEVSQVISMPQHREVEKLKAKDSPLSQSSLCINGSHIYAVDTPAPSTLPKVTLGVLQKSSTLSRSLQNLTKKSEETPKVNLDTRRWSLDKTGNKEGGKLVELLGGQEDSIKATPGRKEGKPVQIATQIVSTSNVEPASVKRAEEVKKEEHKKHKLHLFGGKNESRGSEPVKSGDMSPTGQQPEEKHKGWFGSKEAQNKPSLEVSPMVETSSDTHSYLSPSFPIHFSPASAVDPVSLCSAPRTNPFTPAPITPHCQSPTNPFFTNIQSNPFFEELLADQLLKSPPPTHCLSSFALEPSHAATSWAEGPHSPVDVSIPKPANAEEKSRGNAVIQGPVPTPVPRAGIRMPRPVRTPYPFSVPSTGDWDESFDSFAASRLKPEQKGKGTPRSTGGSLHLAGTRVSLPLVTVGPQEDSSKTQELVETSKANGLVEQPFVQASNSSASPIPLCMSVKANVKDYNRESWLDSAQVIAVEKEASLLSQTDAAAIQLQKEAYGDKSLLTLLQNSALEALEKDGVSLTESNVSLNEELKNKERSSANDTFKSNNVLVDTVEVVYKDPVAEIGQSYLPGENSPRYVSTCSIVFRSKAMQEANEDLDNLVKLSPSLTQSVASKSSRSHPGHSKDSSVSTQEEGNEDLDKLVKQSLTVMQSATSEMPRSDSVNSKDSVFTHEAGIAEESGREADSGTRSLSKPEGSTSISGSDIDIHEKNSNGSNQKVFESTGSETDSGTKSPTSFNQDHSAGMSGSDIYSRTSKSDGLLPEVFSNGSESNASNPIDSLPDVFTNTHHANKQFGIFSEVFSNIPETNDNKPVRSLADCSNTSETSAAEQMHLSLEVFTNALQTNANSNGFLPEKCTNTPGIQIDGSVGGPSAMMEKDVAERDLDNNNRSSLVLTQEVKVATQEADRQESAKKVLAVIEEVTSDYLGGRLAVSVRNRPLSMKPNLSPDVPSAVVEKGSAETSGLMAHGSITKRDNSKHDGINLLLDKDANTALHLEPEAEVEKPEEGAAASNEGKSLYNAKKSGDVSGDESNNGEQQTANASNLPLIAVAPPPKPPRFGFELFPNVPEPNPSSQEVQCNVKQKDVSRCKKENYSGMAEVEDLIKKEEENVSFAVLLDSCSRADEVLSSEMLAADGSRLKPGIIPNTKLESLGDGILSSNEGTELEQYKTCKSTFSLEGLDPTPGTDVNMKPMSLGESKQPCKLEIDSSNTETKSDFAGQTKVNSGKSPYVKLDSSQKDETEQSSEKFKSSTQNTKTHTDVTSENPVWHGTEAPLIHFSGLGAMPSKPPIKAQEATLLNQSPAASWLASSVSQDVVADLKGEEFWKPGREDLQKRHSIGSPFENPFKQFMSRPVFGSGNPFVQTPPSQGHSSEHYSSSISSAQGGSFKDLHMRVAPKCVRSSSLPGDHLFRPFLHENPLAASTPSLVAETNFRLTRFPSPILSSSTVGPAAVIAQEAAAATPSSSSSCPPPQIASALTVLPEETQPAESSPLGHRSSPHPVKPLSSSVHLDEKRQGGSSVPISVLEKLKSTMRPVHSTLQGQHHAEGIKALTSQDHAALYHLTHDELIALLLEREAELDKRGAELQKFECKVHDLEEYIDRLLVRIIEETPTMLQVPQGK